MLGPDVCVGAHAMAVSEGLWDDCDFIRHCAYGTNYATGKTGARLCYISATYYEIAPGEFGKNQEPLPHMINRLRAAAEEAGLTDLFYGVDEGRILAVPSLEANSTEAALVHEAAIGKIAGEQIIKLMTLGLTEAEAEEQIINGFLK